jgi:ATP-binding cassette subfamily B protein
MYARKSKNSRPERIGLRENLRALSYIPRFFSIIWQTSRFLFVVNVLTRLVSSVVPVLMLWVGKLIIDEVVFLVDASDKDFERMWWLLGVELGLAILSNVFSRIIDLTDGLLGDLYSNKSSVELIHKAASLPLSQLEDANFYDKLERARRQTTNRVALMSTILTQIQDLITVISLVAALIVFQPFLILLLVVAVIPSFVNEIRFSRSSYSLVRSWTPERRELDYLRYVGASDVTAKEVKLFGLADFLGGRFSSIADRYYQANRALAIRRATWGSILNIVGDFAYYAAYVIIVIRTVNGVISIGDLTFLAGSFRRLRSQLQAIFSRLTRISESALYLKDYFDFMDIDQSVTILEGGSVVKETVDDGFTFDNVSFRYPGSEDYVLRNLSFTLRAGEKLALVGENGAGKTTLVKLLLRMYEPTEGRILLDGRDIRDFEATSYQRLFGVIFQDFVKYYFTARENIAVGKIDRLEDLDRIEYAAERSLADQVIGEFPEGYDQQLGKRFDRGVELSGGQWQKVALARGYMKDAPVIVLDEPTSALDARAEYEAFQRFIELTRDKTAVLISHRFSTVRMADRIIVLKDGRILEDGSHEELLANHSLYAELFNYQAAGYR